ncbi:MAG: hypothetical protein QOE22_603 [Candidatus Parcubacteria bacterium]|nr:hypothetical protein [Candidatus Parcubacteria bacterium]
MAIGLPGSGKTTFLKPLAEKYGLAYINRDEIREEHLGDARDHSDQKAVWEEANLRTAEALGAGQGVVLDATFLERWKRKSMIDFLRDHNANRIVGVLFDVSFAVAQERNVARDRVVPLKVMQWMEEKMRTEPPEVSEGFDAIYADLSGLEKELSR